MNLLRNIAFSVAATLLFAAQMQAQSPDWFPVQMKAGERPGAREQTFGISAPDESADPLTPVGVFSVADQPLLQLCGSTSTDHCTDEAGFIGASTKGPVWVQFTPYAWATQVSGNLTVEGFTAPLEIDLSDLWTLVENGEVRGAFMGHLEFGRDNWSVFVNGDIISMDPSVQVRRANIDTGLTLTMLELGGAVDLLNVNPDDPVNSPLRVQLLGGARYYAVDTYAILSLPNINPVLQVDQGEQWVDLFAGGRAIARISPGVGAFVRGDVGGFGIGTSSDHAWNFVSGLTVDDFCGCNLVLGYRVFDIQQSLNGGTGAPRGFGVDTVIHGPVVGLSFLF